MLRDTLPAAALFALTWAGVSNEAQAVIPYDNLVTPGQLRGIAHAPGDPWIYGYWEYLPTAFDMWMPGDPEFPLVVFLPGVGEYDDVSSCPGGTDLCIPADCGNDGLCRNLTWGPQLLMQNGNWDEVLRPFIMVSPQHPVPTGSAIEWDLNDLDAYLQFIVDNYPVDERRLYLIGMSQGGRAVLQYTTDYPRRFTAVAPTPGGSVSPIDAACYFQDTALWVFHGENDADGTLGPGVFAPCTMVDVAHRYANPDQYMASAQCASIVGEPRPQGRLTMFEGVAHSAWVQTVDPVGEGFAASEWAMDQGCNIPADFRAYEAALDSDGVYSWFLSLDRPDATAPADVLLHDMPQVSLAATIVDDDAYTIEWTQTMGPPATLSNADTATLDVADLAESEQYEFEVYVVDDDGQWDRDQVLVTTDVFPGPASTGGGSGSSSGTDGTGGTDTGMTTASSSTASSTASTSDTGNASSSGPTDGMNTTGPSTGSAGDTTGGPTSGASASASASGASASASASAGSSGDSTGETEAREAGDLEEGGCSCRTGSRPRGAAMLWLLLGAALSRRRRR